MKIYIRSGWYEDEIEPFYSDDPYVGNTGYGDIDEYELYDYSEYGDFYKQVLRRRIYVPTKVAKDIPDYNAYRKALFNTLFLSLKDGEDIETLYAELSSDYPGIVKRGFLSAPDMLLEIVDATLYAQSVLNPSNVA